MSQELIVKVLEKNSGKWLIRSEIFDLLKNKINRSSNITVSLGQMRRFEEVLFKFVNIKNLKILKKVCREDLKDNKMLFCHGCYIYKYKK